MPMRTCLFGLMLLLTAGTCLAQHPFPDWKDRSYEALRPAFRHKVTLYGGRADLDTILVGETPRYTPVQAALFEAQDYPAFFASEQAHVQRRLQALRQAAPTSVPVGFRFEGDGAWVETALHPEFYDTLEALWALFGNLSDPDGFRALARRLIHHGLKAKDAGRLHAMARAGDLNGFASNPILDRAARIRDVAAVLTALTPDSRRVLVGTALEEALVEGPVVRIDLAGDQAGTPHL